MEELSLKWDEHHPAVISVFEELLAKGTLVDCTIAADGQYVKAHKVVLAACSPYFELLFSQENEKNPIVVLKDMKFQELKYLIDFVYRGQVKLPEDQLDAFVSAAESLQIKGLSGQQKKQISEKSANKTVASREGCSSPIPRKRRRSSRTEPNEDSRSEPGNDSSTDSNIHENFMPTPVSLGAPSTSAASSSSGIASHSVTTQRRQGLPESRFPSHNRPSASPEQVLPDVSTVVKTEPIEEPTEPVEEVFLSEPKNEEYVDDLAMLESGAGSSDTRGGTSQQNTNNYPGYDSTGDTFMMNQMANQNSGPGSGLPTTQHGFPVADTPSIGRQNGFLPQRTTSGENAPPQMGYYAFRNVQTHLLPNQGVIISECTTQLAQNASGMGSVSTGRNGRGVLAANRPTIPQNSGPVICSVTTCASWGQGDAEASAPPPRPTHSAPTAVTSSRGRTGRGRGSINRAAAGRHSPLVNTRTAVSSRVSELPVRGRGGARAVVAQRAPAAPPPPPAASAAARAGPLVRRAPAPAPSSDGSSSDSDDSSDEEFEEELFLLTLAALVKSRRCS